jgi:uncharacterized membrane protein YvbJ
MAFCIKCGKSNPETAKFCTSCGAVLSAAIPVVQDTPKSSNKTWIIFTAIIVIVLGAASYFLFFNKKVKEKETVPGIISESVKGLYPQASERLLTANELANMSQASLRIMRNEIYARHGFVFKKEDMRQYFSQQTWYKPLFNNVDNMLSDVEKKNIVLIRRYENFQEDLGEGFSR